ncbi:AMIN-like domain-containing (lipo)protein [Pseudonocardia oceani]|uniref:AMIN-like domain-containing (lipo)protein n=1 Tax=Pseudonocardia oceani TaxID=2792013 RepID=UPI003FD88408
MFEFDGAVPGYRISYADLPVTSDPAGEEVPLAGGAALQVSLIGSSSYAEVGDPQPAYTVAGRIVGGEGCDRRKCDVVVVAGALTSRSRHPLTPPRGSPPPWPSPRTTGRRPAPRRGPPPPPV